MSHKSHVVVNAVLTPLSIKYRYFTLTRRYSHTISLLNVTRKSINNSIESDISLQRWNGQWKTRQERCQLCRFIQTEARQQRQKHWHNLTWVMTNNKKQYLQFCGENYSILTVKRWQPGFGGLRFNARACVEEEEEEFVLWAGVTDAYRANHNPGIKNVWLGGRGFEQTTKWRKQKLRLDVSRWEFSVIQRGVRWVSVTYSHGTTCYFVLIYHCMFFTLTLFQ